MSFIDTIDDAAAEGDIAALYKEDRERRGYVANFTRVFSHRPQVMRAWQQLNRSIRGTMDPRRYELATLAAATALHSSYCSLAHGKVLADKFQTPDEVAAIAQNPDTAPLSDADRAAMAFAAKVARGADTVTPADVERLRTAGLSDPEIFEVASAAAARCFFSKLLDALGAEPDAVFRSLPPVMVDILTVGRPIAEG